MGPKLTDWRLSAQSTDVDPRVHGLGINLRTWAISQGMSELSGQEGAAVTNKSIWRQTAQPILLYASLAKLRTPSDMQHTPFPSLPHLQPFPLPNSPLSRACSFLPFPPLSPIHHHHHSAPQFHFDWLFPNDLLCPFLLRLANQSTVAKSCTPTSASFLDSLNPCTIGTHLIRTARRRV